jgi:hypothetical protein
MVGHVISHRLIVKSDRLKSCEFIGFCFCTFIKVKTIAMKKGYIFMFIAGLLSLNVFSQTGITNYPVTITSSTAIYNKRSAFVIDNNGNKWIGFNYGNANSFQLLRFNGTQWDTFPAFRSISATNKVNALAVDAANNLWIGSNKGLTKYDGANFTTYNTSNSGIVNDTIISIGCGNGNVYVGSGRGLSVYNGTNFTNYTTASGMNSNIINCITVENANAIWLGNSNGLDKFNGSNFTFSYVTANNTADVVNCIYIDAQGIKWIGTSANGVIKYNNNTFYTMQQLYPSVTEQETLGVGLWPTIVKTICKGPNGGVLFCSPSAPVGTLMVIGRTYEITNTQLYTYMSIAASTTVTGNQYIMQRDVGSNKIFVVSPGLGRNFLVSYDPIPYLGYSLYIDETTANTAF